MCLLNITIVNSLHVNVNTTFLLRNFSRNLMKGMFYILQISNILIESMGFAY